MRNERHHESAAVEAILIGRSAAMRQLRELVVRVAPHDLPVLVEGPNGAGKELVARAIHACSGRTGRYVAFNVCAISDSMFEDALFGHARGAFTGAVASSDGYLLEAHRGTVLLDEIGALGTAAQVKLLRVLETHTFRPVGGAHDRDSDFRLVAATNESMEALMARGSFRRDLAFRLRGIVLRVPPLVERREDVPILAAHYLSRCRGDQPRSFAPGALGVLVQHDWPGNVRELIHVVQCAAVLAPTAVITREHVRDAMGYDAAPVALPATAPRSAFARRRLIEVLEEVAWDIDLAASRLGVHRATVYRRLQRIGLRIPQTTVAKGDTTDRRTSRASPW